MSSSADRAPGGPAARPARPLSMVVLISGRGSNLEAIAEAIRRGDLPATIRSTISNRPDAAGLGYSRQAGIPAESIDASAYRSDRQGFEAALLEAIERHAPDLVVLAGFMRVLSPAFVERFDGRMLNIHPSLLPRHPGLDTHRRALEAGDREHGASVHFVTAEVDGGPVVLQGRIPIGPDDDAARLAARVLQLEHRLYPLALRWFAEGRLRKEGRRVLFDGRPLEAPLDLAEVGGGETRG